MIERRGAYLLAATEEHYVVGRAEGDRASLERFPLDEDGYRAAERRFAELRRSGRRESGLVIRVLAAALWLGVGLWVVTGLGAALLTVSRARGDVFGRLYEVFLLLDSVGFRAAVGALLLLVGILVVERWVAGRSEQPVAAGERSPGVRERISAIDRFLVVVLAAGLALWILGAVTIEVLREPIGASAEFGFGVVGPVSQPHPVAAFVEGMALRMWVAAGVLLAVRWMAGHLRH